MLFVNTIAKASNNECTGNHITNLFLKSTGDHITNVLTITFQFKFMRHLLIGIHIGFRRGKAKVAWDNGGTRERNQSNWSHNSIDNETVEGCMLNNVP